MIYKNCARIYQHRTTFRRLTSAMVQRLSQAPKTSGNVIKRSNSKCGDGGKGGKDKKDNLSVVLHGVGDLRLEQTPMPKVGPFEVLLAVDSVGICGTDVHFLVRGKVGSWEVKQPMVIGHEASGIVAQVGKSVKKLKEGDRVAIEPGQACRYCDMCISGQYNLCPKMKFCAAPPVHGNLRRYYNHSADFCHKLPDHLTMEEGALLEPLSIGVAGCRRAKLRLGSHVLILGAGPVGLATLIAAKAWGVASTTVIDFKEHRLKLAQELGATYAMKSCKGLDVQLMAKEIIKTIGVTPDKTLDCVGTEETVALGVHATRVGGKCVVIGMGADEVKLPLMTAISKEVDLKGVYRYCNDYPYALQLVAAGGTGIKKLVTHHFDIEKSKEAFDTAKTGKGDPVKVMIHVQKRDKNNKKPFSK